MLWLVAVPVAEPVWAATYRPRRRRWQATRAEEERELGRPIDLGSELDQSNVSLRVTVRESRAGRDGVSLADADHRWTTLDLLYHLPLVWLLSAAGRPPAARLPRGGGDDGRDGGRVRRAGGGRGPAREVGVSADQGDNHYHDAVRL